MICEKCWSDAYLKSVETGKHQHECYKELLGERKDNPCPTKEESQTNELEQIFNEAVDDNRISAIALHFLELAMLAETSHYKVKMIERFIKAMPDTATCHELITRARKAIE